VHLFLRHKNSTRQRINTEVNSFTPEKTAEQWLEQGVQLEHAGQIQEALRCYESAIESKPDLARAHFLRGVILLDQGNARDARDAFTSAIELKPDSASAHFNLGAAFARLDLQKQAVSCYRQALSLKPDFAEANLALGASLEEDGLFEAALDSYRKTLEIQPENVIAQEKQIHLLKQLNRTEEVASSYRKILEINPKDFEARFNLGVVLRTLGNCESARNTFELSLELRPDFAATYFHLGDIDMETGRYKEALLRYQQALRIEPNNPGAHTNVGTAYKNLGQLDNALASYKAALNIKPDFFIARSNLLFISNYSSSQTNSELFAEALRFGQTASVTTSTSIDHRRIANPSRPLRIGFVSGDFRSHPVGFFLENVLSELRRLRPCHLTLCAYSNSKIHDEVTERFKLLFHSWLLTFDLSDEVLAKRIRDDEIDILIDLAGHTGSNRLSVFAMKPAPVQVSWLGYCATTGLPEVDYFIADPFSLPPAFEPYFVESVWRLPECYVCLSKPNYDIPITPPPALVASSVTFGSFNNLSKMSNETVRLWAQVLKAVPGSRLFLKTKQLDEDVVRRKTISDYAAHGISADTLILEGHTNERGGHLASYRRVDIALDPFPYNGVTTTAEALWMGVPVLTLAGDRFLSCQGVSLLTNAGLSEWIAKDQSEYIRLAIAAADNLQALTSLRFRLRAQVLASPIFDAARFANNFDFALRAMWEKWCANMNKDSSAITTSTSRIQSESKSENKMWLHIGGKEVKTGWKILNALDSAGVDFVGDVRDLKAFPDNCCEKIYASHVMEHIGQRDFLPALKGIHRLLVKGGVFYFSAPDLDTLCRLFIDPKLTGSERYHVMRMMFGGQTDDFDIHLIGLTHEFMLDYLEEAGFSNVKRVESFDIFEDTSAYKPYGASISLNLTAVK
jgi:protein O-GlcNAc transferase